jgi:hypothetical protein
MLSPLAAFNIKFVVLISTKRARSDHPGPENLPDLKKLFVYAAMDNHLRFCYFLSVRTQSLQFSSG